MPNMFGGDQMDPDYAPHLYSDEFHRRRALQPQQAAEKLVGIALPEDKVPTQAPYGTYKKPNEDEFKAVIAERDRLKAAIITHRGAVADDRCCHIDDDELYAALGDGVKVDRRVGDKVAMIRNCIDFVEKRCDGGGWISYATLRMQRDAVIALLHRAATVLVVTNTGLLSSQELVCHINNMCTKIEAADKEAAAGKIV